VQRDAEEGGGGAAGGVGIRRVKARDERGDGAGGGPGGEVAGAVLFEGEDGIEVGHPGMFPGRPASSNRGGVIDGIWRARVNNKAR